MQKLAFQRNKVEQWNKENNAYSQPDTKWSQIVTEISDRQTKI